MSLERAGAGTHLNSFKYREDPARVRRFVGGSRQMQGLPSEN
jgi:hypothetical protein